MPGRLLLFGHDRPTSPKSRGRSNSSTSKKKSPITRAKDTSPSMDIFRRQGISSHGKRSSVDSKLNVKYESHKPAELDLIVESPPLVMYRAPEHSSGALFSAKLKVKVPAADVTLQSLNMRLVSVTTYKKPFVANCPGCAKQEMELQRWAFLKEPIKLAAGEHYYPFSKLFPGNLPPTTNGVNQHIEYRLYAIAQLSSGNEFRLDWPITLTRALTAGQDRESTRIFPPTEVTMGITMNPTIHPVSDVPFTMRLTNLVEKKDKHQLRWRLARIQWRIEEYENVVSPPCSEHLSQDADPSMQGTSHSNTRSIGHGEIKQGWKTDFVDGVIEGDFTAGIGPSPPTSTSTFTLKPCCDVESAASTNLTITHKLCIEAIVSQELAADDSLSTGSPTDTNRVLRCNFGVQVTQKSGLGISWDEEAPPLYEDVPDSPPSYAQMLDYLGPALDEDRMDL